MPPTPKPPGQRRRRNATVPMVTLPAGGRPGPPPEWPLDDGPYEPEVRHWRELWATPQAAQWEVQGLGTRIAVALYVRLLVRLQHDESMATAAWTDQRRRADDLGLTPTGLLRLRWQVLPEGSDPDAPDGTDTPPQRVPPASATLYAVDPSISA